MKTADDQIEPQKSYRMCGGVIRLPDHGTLRKIMIETLRTLLVTRFNLAIQEILSRMAKSLSLNFTEDNKIKSAKLSVQISGKDISRAERLLEKDITDFGYTNSYRLTQIIRGEEGKAEAIFEIAAEKISPPKYVVKSEKVSFDIMAILRHQYPQLHACTTDQIRDVLEDYTRQYPESKTAISPYFSVAYIEKVRQRIGKEHRVFNAMPANFLAQTILSWCRYPELEKLMPTNAAGVAQKIPEQLLSFLKLRDGEPNTSFPSVGERSPEAKRVAWLNALERISGNMSGFEYKRARDIDPTISPDDPKGDRRINVDEDWKILTELDRVARFPVSFAKNDIVVYERWTDPEAKRIADEARLPNGRLPNKLRNRNYETNQGRFYALIPLPYIEDPRLLWWKKCENEFTPLPAFGKRSLPKNASAMMIPLMYRDNLDMLRDPMRKVKWSILTEDQEHKFRHGHKGNNQAFLGTRWVVKFATETSHLPRQTETKLGIHLHSEKDPADEKKIKLTVVWALAREGKIINEGEFPQTEILDYALLKKYYREYLQRSLRWVGGMKFRAELKRRTDTLAHKVVALAHQHNAEIVFEDISYVKRKGQGPVLNSIHSLWNYSDFTSRTEFFAKDREMLPTSKVNEYRLKYKCPACEAMRQKGQTKENADTWRENDILDCRKCKTQTVQDKFYFARRVALFNKPTRN